MQKTIWKVGETWSMPNPKNSEKVDNVFVIVNYIS